MNNKKIRYALIISISIILIIIILLVIFLNNIKKVEKDTEISQNITNYKESSNKEKDDLTEEDKEKIQKLKSVSESERIRTYLGTYFGYLENKKYDSAYSLLYPKFKDNYFPTLEDYEKYIKNEDLSDMLSIDYNSIHMQGKYYIVKLSIGNLLDRATIKKDKTFIIQENDYNDFYISFKK